jgi:hypothetical protein
MHASAEEGGCGGTIGGVHPPRKAAGDKLRRTAGGSQFLGGELS